MKQGRCPVCGHEINYGTFEFGWLFGDGYYEWDCPHCQATGKEWYTIEIGQIDVESKPNSYVESLWNNQPFVSISLREDQTVAYLWSKYEDIVGQIGCAPKEFFDSEQSAWTLVKTFPQYSERIVEVPNESES